MLSASTIGLFFSFVVLAALILNHRRVIKFLTASAVLMSESAPRSELDLSLLAVRPAR